MTTDYGIEALKQRWGEQRARNSGWTGEQFDVLDASDPRFVSFGIVSSPGKLRNQSSRLSSDCIMHTQEKRRCDTKSFRENSAGINFIVPAALWQTLNPQLHTGKRALSMVMAKFAALQFGMRMDERWLINQRTAEQFFRGVNQRAKGYPHLSMKCSIDHVCRNSHCLNPGHLQLVPVSENDMRTSLPIPGDTIECLDGRCNFQVLATWPFGFNLCQACGGDAPILHRSMRQMEMELS
jgi:hypothetical protein